MFDEDAELYDRARPGYPDALLDDVVELARLHPGSRVIEIGGGTGQATIALARRGLSIVVVELGASLAATLQHKTRGLPVDVVVGSFEDWEPARGQPFDAIAAFTAWHWLTPGIRTDKAQAALRPGGSLVTVTTTHVLGGTVRFFDDAQACYERWDPATPPGLRLAPAEVVAPTTDEVDTSPVFVRSTRRRYEHDVEYTTGEYLALLNTYSGHRAMLPHRRAGLMRCIEDLIENRYAGVVTKLRVALHAPVSAPTAP